MLLQFRRHVVRKQRLLLPDPDSERSPAAAFFLDCLSGCGILRRVLGRFVQIADRSCAASGPEAEGIFDQACRGTGNRPGRIARKGISLKPSKKSGVFLRRSPDVTNARQRNYRD